jgi:hypothetical protein
MGRPMCTLLALARLRPSDVRAKIRDRSNSANPPSTVSINRPCGVVVLAHASARLLNPHQPSRWHRGYSASPVCSVPADQAGSPPALRAFHLACRGVRKAVGPARRNITSKGPMHSSKKRRGTEGKLAMDVPQPAGSGQGRCRLCLEATDTQKSPGLLAGAEGGVVSRRERTSWRQHAD